MRVPSTMLVDSELQNAFARAINNEYKLKIKMFVSKFCLLWSTNLIGYIYYWFSITLMINIRVNIFVSQCLQANCCILFEMLKMLLLPFSCISRATQTLSSGWHTGGIVVTLTLLRAVLSKSPLWTRLAADCTLCIGTTRGAYKQCSSCERLLHPESLYLCIWANIIILLSLLILTGSLSEVMLPKFFPNW